MKWLVLFLQLVLFASLSKTAELQRLGPVEFAGLSRDQVDVSAIAVKDGWALLGGDEGKNVFPLKRAAEHNFESLEPIRLLDEGEKELDAEGIATDGEHWYVVGSHSQSRKKLDGSYAQNRERLAAEPKRRESTEHLIRFKLEGGAISGKKQISLRDTFAENEVLKRFVKGASKENGVDIEGLAIKGGRLYLGFRAPVFRGGFVPVMRLTFDEPDENELLFVNLGGRGIREIAAVQQGFLVIAGPVDEDRFGFELYHWDGKDCVPGEGSPGGRVKSLGMIPTPAGAKAEGLAVLNETSDNYEILIVYDGPTGGEPTRFQVAKSSF